MTEETEKSLTSEEALEKLKQGNERFAASKQIHPRQSPEVRAALLDGQHPFAAILGCSDSRVSPELIFDQGLGDLFVIRVAGQVLHDSVQGSIDYAAGHLGIPLIVVLGHSSCGMIQACADSLEVEGSLIKMAEKVQPVIEKSGAQPGDLVENAARANAVMIAENLKTKGPVLPGLVNEGTLKVIPAFYALDSGKVDWRL